MPQRPTQKSFRGRDDSVGLNTNTFTYALNANFTFSVLAPFRIRFCIQDVSSGGTATYHLRYSKNGGGYSASTNITNASAQVKIVNSAQFADNDPTTQLLDGTGTWANGAGMDSSENSPSITEAALGQTEVEWCLQFVAADVTNGDTFAFEVFRGTTAMYAYTSIPTVTVQKVFSISAPAQAAKVSEGLNAGLSTPAVWQPALTESAKATEAIGVTVAEAPIVDLSVQVVQSVKYADYVHPPVWETAKLTESVAAAVAAQVTREVSTNEATKGTEDVAISVAEPITLEVAEQVSAISINEEVLVKTSLMVVSVETCETTEEIGIETAIPVTLEVAVEQTAGTNEDYTVILGEVPIEYFECQVADTAHVVDYITPPEWDRAKVSESVSASLEVLAEYFEVDVVTTVRLTEAESTIVEGMLPDLNISGVTETMKATEATATQVIAQLARELAAIDSVAVVEEVGAVLSAVLNLDAQSTDTASISEVIAASVESGEEEIATRYLYPNGIILSRCLRVELFHIKK